jgi:hypothetical protein
MAASEGSMKLKAVVATGSAMILAQLAGCGYVAGNYPSPHAGFATRDTIVVVDGRKYRCFNEDGTMRCEELRAAFAGIDNKLPVEASQRGLGPPAGR